MHRSYPRWHPQANLLPHFGSSRSVIVSVSLVSEIHCEVLLFQVGYLPRLLDRVSLWPPDGQSDSTRAVVSELPRLSVSVRIGSGYPSGRVVPAKLRNRFS